MFRKRPKKTFPPGTFIPTPVRIFAILQLCIAFSILLWHASYPFMGELFEVKSKMLIYQAVMGTKDESNRIRFGNLPEKEQQKLLEGYQHFQEKLEKTFYEKLKQSLKKILNLPTFELAWLFFSVILAIMLLKKIEGAKEALWILPLLVFAYAGENRGLSPRILSDDQKLFPSEELIVEKYLDVPFSQNVFEQKEQLKKGWDAYLIKEWAPEGGNEQDGLFAFNLERVKILAREKPVTRTQPDSLSLLAIYLGWNISFALVARQYLTLRDA